MNLLSFNIDLPPLAIGFPPDLAIYLQESCRPDLLTSVRLCGLFKKA